MKLYVCTITHKEVGIVAQAIGFNQEDTQVDAEKQVGTLVEPDPDYDVEIRSYEVETD